MKPESRVLGIDDGPFRFGDERVPVAGVLMRGPAYVEGVLAMEVAVDGSDATEVLVSRIRSSRYLGEMRAILLDGAALGGFNVVDIHALHEATGVPVVGVTRGLPDATGVRAALEKHFSDWERRWGILERQWPERVSTSGKDLAIATAGATRAEAAEVLARFTVRGLTPEPIRLAHLIATAMVSGESRGQS